MRETRPGKALLAITAAAVTLPGAFSQQAQGATPAEQPQASYRVSRYQEEPLPADRLAAGDAERYEIDIHQLRFRRALGADHDVTFDLVHESMSGASPWFVVPRQRVDDQGEPLLDAQGEALREPVQVMSGATIFEDRTAFDVALSTYFAHGRNTTALSYSTENDYESLGLSSAQSFTLSDATELELSLSASRDILTPTHSEVFTPSVERAQKSNLGVSVGLSQVINQTTVLNTAVGYNVYTGFLSDPYKMAWVASGTRSDTRPDEREQWSWNTQLRHYLNPVNAAVHLDYRLFADTWEVTSHRVRFAWHQNLGRYWRFAPEVRWYSQDEAAFFRNYYDHERADGFYSSDYRLSPFAAVSAKATLSLRLDSVDLRLSYEHYEASQRDDNPALSSPALVQFAMLSAGLTYRF